MKKESQKHKKNQGPLVALMIGGLILIVAAILFSQMLGSSAGGTPVLSVDREVIDYGTVKFETPLSFKITVTNTGDGPLRFKQEPKIQVLEGC